MVKLSDVNLPVVLKDKLLFSEGHWNRWDIKGNEISKAFTRTDWEKKQTQSLYFEHKDKDAREWTGNVINPRMKGSDLYGDLEIWDAQAAIALDEGKAPFAVSAKIGWPSVYKDPTDFSFTNFSLVADPGVRKEEIFVNFSNDGTDNEATFTFDQSIHNRTIERRNNSQMEEGKEIQATFSAEDFSALEARVAAMETQFAKFSEAAEAEPEAEPAKEEVKEEVKEVVEEVKEAEEAAPEAEPEKEEVAEEVKEEPKEEVKEAEPEAEPAKEEVKEEATEAEFSAAMTEMVKAIKEAVGTSAVPAGALEVKEAGFNTAYNRIEKEMLNE